MPESTSTDHVALRKLLADLFPNVRLSRAGVALLAAEINHLEQMRDDTSHEKVEPQVALIIS
jgi:hypothetical protein